MDTAHTVFRFSTQVNRTWRAYVLKIMNYLDTTPSRRAVLIAGAGAAGALVLTACGSDDDSPGSATSTGPTGSTGSASATSSGTSATDDPSTSTPTTSASRGSGSGDGSVIASLDDIETGSAISATLDGEPIIVARPTATTAAAFSAICTHQRCTVAANGNCPCHGSKFNALTGEVINGPASSPLAKIAVQVVEGKVVPA